MVLVDTSVWIRFLANRAPYAAELDLLLEQGEAAGHDLIEGELLIGDSGARVELLKSYALMPRVSTVRHAEIVDFVQVHKLHGKGVGWVDVHLLASARASDVALWTADERLARLAGELGVKHAPRGG